MTFSDDDLKQLREWNHSGSMDMPFSDMFIDALLARLEAAERCVEECATDENCCDIPERGEDDISPYYLWRRAAGK